MTILRLRRSIPLRSYLTVLSLVTIIPLLVFSGLMIYLLAQRERETFERGARDRMAAVLTAVDTQLKSSIATLEALASLRHFDRDDLQSFREQAARVLRSQPDWFTITLAAPSGQQIVNLLQPADAALPLTHERKSFDRVLRAAKPVVGNMVLGGVAEQPEFRVRVPVVRNGVTTYVLSAVVRPESIYQLLLAQKLPSEWIGAVLDANRHFVARTVSPKEHVGHLTSGSLQAALDRASEGWFQGKTVEGWDVFTAYNRSTFSDWTVALSIPADIVRAPFHGPILYLIISGIILLGTGTFLAWWLSNKAAGSIESLVGLITDLGLGKISPAANDVRSGISEVDHLKDTFLTARHLIEERSEDRDQLEIALRHDIAQRVRTEQFLLLQIATGRALRHSEDLTSAAPIIVQAICELTEWKVAALWGLDRKTGELRLIEVRHVQASNVPEFVAATRQLRLARGVGLVGRVWASGEPVWIPDVTQDRNFLRIPQATKEGLHTGVCVPVTIGTEVLGVIECFSHETRQSDQETLQTLANIGTQLGQFIERRRAERELAGTIRRREALYQFLDRRQRSHSIEEMYDAALDGILSALPCGRAAILCHDTSKVMRFIAWRGLSDDFRIAVEAYSPWELDAADQQPVCVSDVASANLEESIRATLESECIGALACIPLVLNGTLAGGVMIYYDAPHAFNDVELELILTIARQLAVGIERHRAKEALTKKTAELQAVFDILPVGVVIAEDPKADHIRVNSWFEQALGLRHGENASVTGPGAESLPYRLVRDGEPIPGYELPVQLAARTGKAFREVEFDAELANGRTINLMANTAPLFDEQGNVRGAVGALVDITRLKQAEAALKKFNEDLERLVAERTKGLMQMNAQLVESFSEREKLQEELRQSQKIQAVGTLAAGVAHDFNNILNIIQAYVSVLAEQPSHNSEITEGLTVINEMVRRGSALVQQLLTLARKTGGAEWQSVDVNALLDGVLPLIKETFPKTVELNCALEPNLPAIVADRNQIEQAVLNLCVNARDAMPNGGKLIVKTQSVDAAALQHLGERLTGSYVCVEVSDSGIGMDESIRERIFEPFFTTKDKGRGTGLGLSVVYGIVKNHNGFVEVVSTPMAGTSFRLYFPAAFLDDIGKARALHVIAETTSPPDAAGTVLIAEDEITMLQLLERIFIRRGYTILKAADGQTALDLYQQHKDEISVILLDMGLPKISGRDVLLKIRSENPNVKVIVTSGYIDPATKADIDSAHVRFLDKPYTPTDVFETLRSLTETHS